MNFSFLGTSPITTIVGYILAILQLVYPLINKPEFNWKTDWVFIVSAILTAFMGRRAKQTDGVTPAEGFAIKQAIIAPTHEEEQEVVEEEPVKINKRVAAVAKENVPEHLKKKRVTRPRSAT